MPKRVKGQEDDEHKHDLGKKKKTRGSGEMVAGRMATRSATRALSKKGSEDPLSSSQSDELHKMFLEWTKKLKKTYKSVEEQNERFLIWCSTKKRMDEEHSHKPDYISSDLNFFADRTSSERAKMVGGGTFTEDPYEGRPPILNLWKTKKGLKEVKKATIEFDKWVVEHGRKYVGKERKNRFLAFLDNKTRIDACNRVRPGFWTRGYNQDSMDKWFWEKCSHENSSYGKK